MELFQLKIFYRRKPTAESWNDFSCQFIFVVNEDIGEAFSIRSKDNDTSIVDFDSPTKDSTTPIDLDFYHNIVAEHGFIDSRLRISIMDTDDNEFAFCIYRWLTNLTTLLCQSFGPLRPLQVFNSTAGNKALNRFGGSENYQAMHVLYRTLIPGIESNFKKERWVDEGENLFQFISKDGPDYEDLKNLEVPPKFEPGAANPIW